MSIQITPTILNDIFTTFDSTFNNVYENTPTIKDKLAMLVQSSGASNKYGWFDAIPGVREWIGSREVNTMETLGYEIVNRKFELSQGIKRTDIEDDQTGIVSSTSVIIAQMANNTAIKPDLELINLLVDGRSDNAYDGTSFFNTGRTWKGNTASNSATAALEQSTFETATTTLWNVVGRQGKDGEAPLIANPKFMLICSPTLEYTARGILEANLINGGEDSLTKGRAELLVTPYLSTTAGKAGATDATNYWFLVVTNAAGGIGSLVYQEREAVKTTQLTLPDDFPVWDKDEYIYSIDGRWGTGYGLWQLAYGSNGTT